MKKILSLSVIMIASLVAASQNVAINNTGSTPHPSAMLDINSESKGVLIPRLTTQQRVQMLAPANGLLVFDSNTNSFWYFSTSWKELGNAGSGGVVTGSAGGDLTGNYPAPNVAKIQNMAVDPSIPLDRQVMKWHTVNNKWQGQNDSLFLPYNVSSGSATKLFGITNTNTNAGSTAIYGKSGTTGSGLTPAATAGVWGDNSTGVGVIGTGNSGQGLYGFSFNNNGVQGYSVLAGMAGIYGSHANDDGIGVLGEIQNNGIGIYGKATGNLGKAGLFESLSASHTDTTFKTGTSGTGLLASFNISNAASLKPAMDITHAGNGNGLKLRLTKANGAANAIDVVSQGTGIGVYSKSEKGIPGRFEITNPVNTYPVMMLGTNSAGTSLYISSANPGITGPVVDVLNEGSGTGLSIMGTGTASKNAVFASTSFLNLETAVTVQHDGEGRGLDVKLSKPTNANAGIYVNTEGMGNAGYFSANNLNNTQPSVKIKQAGSGRGIEATITNAASSSPAVYASSTGSSGVLAYAQGTAITGQSTIATAGIGVLGQAALNSTTGIGVKGISNSTNLSSGAVTAINNANGVAMYAETDAGIAVYGKTNKGLSSAIVGLNEAAGGYGVTGYTTATDGVGIFGDAGQGASLSKAALFRNVNAANFKTVVDIINSGTGGDLFMMNSNASNTNPMQQMRNNGTGKFLLMEDVNADEKFSVAKNGNIKTDGTLTVKGDKGIVRNSSATQLRMEVFQANFTIPISGEKLFTPDESFEINLTFPTAFAAVPSVYIGNVQNKTTYITSMQVTITDVTATGCKLIITNTLNHNLTLYNNSWKLMVVGAE